MKNIFRNLYMLFAAAVFGAHLHISQNLNAQPIPVSGEQEFAIEKLDEKIANAKNDKERVEAVFEKGQSLLLRGYLDHALRRFDEALAIKPDALDIRLYRARTIDMLGRHEEAFTELASLSKIAGDTKTAVIAFANSLKRNQPPSDIETKKIQLAVNIHLPVAYNYIFLQQYDKALEEFNNIVELEKFIVKKGDEEHQRMYVNGVGEIFIQELETRYWIAALTARLTKDTATANNSQYKAAVKSMSPYGSFNKALKDLYNGKGSVADVFKSLDSQKKGKPEYVDSVKERYRAKASYLCAVYLRFVVKDESAATALLEKENSLPPNGAIERCFIRQELAGSHAN